MNEEETLQKTISTVRKSTLLRDGSSIPIEVIVSDGGSIDKTFEIAKESADKVISGTPGRFKQLNRGAYSSKGDVLLFLHGDTILPEDGIKRIYYHFSRFNQEGGGFTKNWIVNPRMSSDTYFKIGIWIFQSLGNLFVKTFRLFPGDNAIFIARELFNSLQGYAPLWICEGFDLSARMKEIAGKNITCITSNVHTSARRFEQFGLLRTLLVWLFTIIFWKLGMSPPDLKRYYENYFLKVKK